MAGTASHLCSARDALDALCAPVAARTDAAAHGFVVLLVALVAVVAALAAVGVLHLVRSR